MSTINYRMSIPTASQGQALSRHGRERRDPVSRQGLVERVRAEFREMPCLRLTSAQAQRFLIQGGVRREKRKGKVDQTAAAILLQSYLDSLAK